MIQKTQLFGAYFFLSDTYALHKVVIYKILDIISDFGGVYLTFVYPTFVMIGSLINN